MSNLKNEVAASIRASFEDRGAVRAAEAPGGAFREVIEEFVAALKEFDFLDARQRSGSSGIIYINLWPRFRPTESTTILTLWLHHVGEKEAVRVLGAGEVILTAPEALADYFKKLVKSDVFLDGLEELKSRYQGAADGMLRSKSLDYMASDDLAIIVPHEDFVRLAQQAAGQDVTIQVELWKRGKYERGSTYKFLTSSGHVLAIAQDGIQEKDGTLVVTGKKQAAEQRAA